MLDSIYIVDTAEDMGKVENRVCQLMLGINGRCSIFNTTEYTRFRLAAIYSINHDVFPITFCRGPIRLCLQDNTVSIFYDIDDLAPSMDVIEHDHTISGKTKRAKVV
jgi:hypothetical protein